MAAGTRFRTLSVAACLALAGTGQASEVCTEDAVIVFDGSGSMSEMGFNNLGEPRIFEARRAVRQVVPEIARMRRLGLVIYGPGAPETDSCDTVDTRFAPRWEADGLIISEIEALRPSGETPIADAVAQAAELLRYRERPGAIVLVTDGKETCGGAPCQLAAELAATGADLTVHVIGYKVRGDFFAWEGQPGDYADTESTARCLADATGGEYVGAESVDDLIAALRVTLGCNVYGALEPLPGARAE
jgi:Ca-activated chloride channel family protein